MMPNPYPHYNEECRTSATLHNLRWTNRRERSASMGSPEGRRSNWFESLWCLVNKANGMSRDRYKDYYVCAISGFPEHKAAHVLPSSDYNTMPQEAHLCITGILSHSWKMRNKKEKMDCINLIPLQTTLGGKMEPNIGGFLFFPTLGTYRKMTKMAEERLRDAEASRESFYQFNSSQLLDRWDRKLFFRGNGRNDRSEDRIFEYEAYIPIRVRESGSPAFFGYYNDDAPVSHLQVESQPDGEEDANTHGFRQAQYNSPIKIVELPLDPFIVVLVSTFTILRLTNQLTDAKEKKKGKAKKVEEPKVAIVDEHLKDLMALGEYFLSLSEVDTPSSFRQIPDRPDRLLGFARPDPVPNANPTHRFIKNFGCNEGGLTSNAEGPAHDQVADGQEAEPSRGRTRSGKAYSSDAVEEDRQAAVTTSMRKLKLDDGKPPSDESVPGLDDSTSTMEYEPVISPPTLHRDVFEEGKEAGAKEGEESLTPEVCDSDGKYDVKKLFNPYERLVNPFDTWKEWRQDIWQQMQDIRETIYAYAFPQGIITSALLKKLRCTRFRQAEAEMKRNFMLLDKINDYDPSMPTRSSIEWQTAFQVYSYP